MKPDETKSHQLELLPSERPHVEAITPDLVARVCRQETFLDAWNYTQKISCLSDKTIYTRIGVKKSHWSKITAGEANPPADERFLKYFHVNESLIPLIWLAESLGFDFLSMRKHYASDVEKENADLKEENAALRRIVARGRV